MNTVSRNLLILFLIVVWVLYTIFVYQGCYDTLCPPCGDVEDEAVIVIPPNADNPYDLSFSWAIDTPLVKQSFGGFADSLIGETSETKILTITGKYFQAEPAPEGFENMGLARAENLRQLYFSELPREQLRLKSRMMQSEPEGAREGYFLASEFKHLEPINGYPLAFLWKNPKPFSNESFNAQRDALMQEAGGDGILQITGLYYEDETTAGQNIGLERARLVREQFFADLPDDKVELRARADQNVATAKDGYFEAVLLEWTSDEDAVTETVEELADRIIIRFPYNSVEKDYDPEVDEYLKQLADRVKGTGEAIQLTGHTDDSGAPDYNMDLGMRRAQQIQSILLGYGISADQITVESRGETQAVAPNSTEEGRHRNRRVEVRLIKE